MNATLELTGVQIRYVDIRKNPKSPKQVIAHMSADYGAAICNDMGWQPYVEGITSAKLEGMLASSHMVLTPTDEKLKHHEIQVDLTEVTEFGYYTSKEGESERSELRFQMRTNALGAAALFEGYWEQMGDARANLKIAYAKQEQLPLQAEVARA